MIRLDMEAVNSIGKMALPRRCQVLECLFSVSIQQPNTPIHDYRTRTVWRSRGCRGGHQRSAVEKNKESPGKLELS